MLRNLAFALLFGLAVLDARSQVAVHPTGDPALDVENVRAAVRNGGTVLLKATDAAGVPREFAFGDFPVAAIDWNVGGSGFVALGIHGDVVPVQVGPSTLFLSFGNDVRLVGETVDGSTTTIRGGTVPMRNFGYRDVAGYGIRRVYGIANLSIAGIRFEESALQSVYTFQGSFLPQVQAAAAARGASSRIELVGNEFIDVKPAFDYYWYALGAVTDSPLDRVLAAGNRVRFTPGRWAAAQRQFERDQGLPVADDFWEGLSFADLRSPSGIRGNEIAGVDLGILVYFDGTSLVEVTDNRVTLRAEGTAGIFLRANHRYRLEGNSVTASGSYPDGIVLWASDPGIGINDSTIRGNGVALDGSYFGGISLVGAGRGNYFGQNRIAGSAAYALGLVDDGSGYGASANAFAGNNISSFEAIDSPFYGSAADVFFDAHTSDNVFFGDAGVVKDLGTGNSITGDRRAGYGPGPTLRKALAAKRELLRAPDGPAQR